MSIKNQLIHEIDVLIEKHGADNPALLRDLQTYRDALANALNKKEMGSIALKILAVAKFAYDHWPD
jgi:hypothetical protein